MRGTKWLNSSRWTVSNILLALRLFLSVIANIHIHVAVTWSQLDATWSNRVLTWLVCVKYIQKCQSYSFSKGDSVMQYQPMAKLYTVKCKSKDLWGHGRETKGLWPR